MEIKGQNNYTYLYGIEEGLIEISIEVEKEIEAIFKNIDSIREYNQIKVIKAMQDNKLSDSHFAGTTGYGYGDRGREVLDLIYADIFKAESALVRHQIVSGTHAIALCMFGVLRPGDELLSITGKPYDTLEEVIGIRGNGEGSLREFGVSYKQVELIGNGSINYAAVERAVTPETRMVLIQRSRGYCWRSPISIKEMREAIRFIKNLKKDLVILVDNCYGEFVEKMEPVEVGADLAAGSLIKNPGGGLAPTGGYIVGKEAYVKKAAYRLTAPGIGNEAGPTLGHSRLMFQGLFLSPHVVAESLKGAIFCSALMQKLGFDISPSPSEKRGDIIQAIKFNDEKSLISFCQGIQKGSPIDAFVTPEPWEMPGYNCPVIMAAGGFIQGSSIELSADAPIKPPYIAYMQGGLVYEHVKLGTMIALQKMIDEKILEF
jgi:cystathionine beta-lyase family protein involved in aluminum resistance